MPNIKYPNLSLRLSALTLALAIAGPALDATPTPTSLTLEAAVDNGASFSWVHEATSAKGTFGTVDYYMSGPADRIGTPSGTYSLTGTGDFSDLNAISFSGLAGTLNINGNNFGNYDTIVLSGGSLNFGSLTEGNEVGRINYEIVSSVSTDPDLTGTFIFDYYDFTNTGLGNGPNNIDVDLSNGTFNIQLWGNNFGQKLATPTDPADRLGIDLYLTGTIPSSPTPPASVGGSTALLLGGPLLLMIALRRPRNRRKTS